MGVKLELESEAIAQFCQKHGIRELSLFGSVLREDFRGDSDVDVLVQFDPGARTGLLEYCRILEELEVLLGRKVDLVTPDGLSPYLKDRILASREVVYARRADLPRLLSIVRPLVEGSKTSRGGNAQGSSNHGAASR